MSKRIPAVMAGAAALAAATLLALDAGAATAASKSKGRPDSGVAYFSITHTAGNAQFAAGQVTDKVLGNGAALYTFYATSSSGTVQVNVKKVTFFTSTGSLSGTASATLSTSGSTETITGGKLNLTKGAGSLKGHSLTGTFSGTANLTANQLMFRYKATYR